MKRKNLKSLIQTKQKTISRETGYPSKKSGRDGDFQVRRISGQGIFLFYKWHNTWYSARLTVYRPKTSEHKQPVKVPIGVKPTKQGELSIDTDGNLKIKKPDKIRQVIAVDSDGEADVHTIKFSRVDTSSPSAGSDDDLFLSNTGSSRITLKSGGSDYDAYINYIYTALSGETLNTHGWCIGMDSSATKLFEWKTFTGPATTTPSSGGTVQMTLTDGGDLTTTGFLDVGECTAVGGDTHSFVVRKVNGVLHTLSTSLVAADILTFGIADTNAVKIDSDSVADDEYARFTANGLESRSGSEVRSDIGAGVGTVTSVGTTGTVNGVTLTGTVTSSGNLTLGGTLAINNGDWSGTDLSVANGGTGASTLTDNYILTGTGTSAITAESNLTFDGTDLSIVETGKIYLDGGSNTYIHSPSSDACEIYVGGDRMMAMFEVGGSGNYTLFSHSVGFTQGTVTYDATDTWVYFNTVSQKQFLTFGSGNIADLNLKFSGVSGNFTLVIKQDGTGSRTVASDGWLAFDNGGVSASGSSIILWPSGIEPTLTTDGNAVDIVTFYWDATNKIAYGVISLDFK